MKRTLLTLLIGIFAISMFASESTQMSKKEMKEAKRATEAYKDSISGAIARNAIESGEWIFRATTINVSSGPMIGVSANLNFLMVQGEEFTFQTSTGFGGGPNNMGGITTTGLINVEDVSVDKHGNITYILRLKGTLLNANATLDLRHNSNMADLYLNIDRGTHNISMTGTIYTIGSTQIFEGALK